MADSSKVVDFIRLDLLHGAGECRKIKQICHHKVNIGHLALYLLIARVA